MDNYSGMDGTQLAIGDSVQLFLDNLLIEATRDVTRRWYSPIKDEGLPLIKKDKPWENIPYFTYSNYCVLRDPRDNLFKCWYEDLKMSENENFVRAIQYGTRQCYAQSEDGLKWYKPELTFLLEDGRKTNIVFGGDDRGGVHSAYVVIDPNPPREEERFRMMYTRYHPDETKGIYGHSIECAYSSDGIHWSIYDKSPRFGISKDQLDDVALIHYDEDSKMFVMNTRHIHMYNANTQTVAPEITGTLMTQWRSANGFALRGWRRIFQTRSSDFINWSNPILIADVDDRYDNIDSSLYGMSQFKVGNTYLGFAGLFHVTDNTMDVVMLCSHDEMNWHRCYEGRPILQPRGKGYWDAYMNSLSSPPIEVGDEYWFFHGGTASHHDYWLMKGHEDIDHPETKDPEKYARFGLGRAVLRKEGFASIHAGAVREGVFVTRALISEGTRLVINARCFSGGYILTEIADQFNNIISETEKENCDPFTGDTVEHIVTWKGNNHIPNLKDDMLKSFSVRRIRFYIKNAEIFSFRIDRPEA